MHGGRHETIDKHGAGILVDFVFHRVAVCRYFHDDVDVARAVYAGADLIDALENPDLVAGSNQIMATIDQMDAARVQLSNKRAEYGPKLYRLEHSENHWSNLIGKLEMNIGKIENADVTKAAVQLQSIELAYQSTIATAARMIQPGLLNFLR